MSTKYEWVETGGKKLKLSNLRKPLYPDDSFLKAQVIEYYLNIAPTILRHIRERPLTLIRYPDGINENSFFQKEKPDWTPDWIDSVPLGDEKKTDYLTANNKASLIWIANLAALEIHQMQVRKSNPDSPDTMAFDLDPPDSSDFEAVKELAFGLKDYIEDYGYHTFVKTTGGKGIHLVVPLTPGSNTEKVFEISKEIAATYVQDHKDETTLQIRKNSRKGRILIDIYRNRSHQTIVSPYSLRAKPGAPVSMPVTWQELSDLTSSQQYHIKNVVDKVKTDGDAWEGIGGYATPLHTEKKKDKSANAGVPTSRYHKTPEQLKEYTAKRDFKKTREPEVKNVEGEGNRFTLQRHHATRLHYDLRLEQDGVLKSWAVPKGLPPRPGVKRLAMQTEDHPLEYLTFEGEIPKGEYGGGKMWVYASGKYEIIKQKESSLAFRLESSSLSGEYRMYKMKGKEWLIEKMDEPQVDWLKEPVEPMQGKRVAEVPGEGYTYEVKWDGIRALISFEGDEIQIHTRNQKNVTDKFPELQNTAAFRAECGLFDGEIVSLDRAGKPDFQEVINRLKSSSSKKIQRLSKTRPVNCYLFDCLYMDGRPLIHEPLWRRYEWLQDSVKKGTPYRMSELVENGKGLFEAVKKLNLEGIMAKKEDSRYLPGKRSELWLKVKTKETADCLVIGYTDGSGERNQYFGALHLAERKDGELKYRGKVGTGFDLPLLREIYQELKELKKIDKPIEHAVQQEKQTTWVEPELVVEVSYSSLTDDRLFREAVFERMRPELQV